MKFRRSAAIAGAFAAALAMGCVALAQNADDVELKLETGPSKFAVEGPVKAALKRSEPTRPIVLVDAEEQKRVEKTLSMGVSKGLVEVPVKKALLGHLVLDSVGNEPANAYGMVEPGKVRWHASPDHALRAAKKSGKPVLVFQLLGRLDETFC